jgi:peptide/nickel transport system permease protein
MRGYLLHLVKRLGQFLLVVLIGINIAYVITHATPIDPVEQSVAAVTSYGNAAPEAINQMRQSLRELYGLQGSPWRQYLSFWGRIVRADFGPSLSAFPTPVSTLIARALPWTIGLLVSSTLIAWALGNYLGGLAGYHRDSRVLKAMGILAMMLHPAPYYIVALILLILFGYVWPILPIAGGSAINMERGFNLAYVGSVAVHSILPMASLVLVGIGSWFLGMRSLEHRDRGLCRLCRIRRR